MAAQASISESTFNCLLGRCFQLELETGASLGSMRKTEDTLGFQMIDTYSAIGRAGRAKDRDATTHDVSLQH